jgi:mannitol-specific phosphotransferase system IIBC component
MGELAKQWGGFGIIVLILGSVVSYLFSLLINNHKAEQAQWLATSKAMQAQLDKAYEQNIDIHEQRIKESRDVFQQMLTLSTGVISSTLGTKEALSDLKDQLKGMQEDGADEHRFVQGLLTKLAETKG